MGGASGDVTYAEGTPLDEEYESTKAKVIAEMTAEPHMFYEKDDLVSQTGDQVEEISESLEELAETELVHETDQRYTVNTEADLYHTVTHLERVRLQQSMQTGIEELEIGDELIEATDWVSSYIDSELNIT